MEALKGKKTYFTAAAAVVTALGAYFAGEVDLSITIQACFGALMVVFLRQGVTSEAKKVVEAPKEG
jgi:hypothetical protein|tara:strand:+ start:6163 stop:6360 length:198 start_codon:yes stop_codon:yes gene_type:complete